MPTSDLGQVADTHQKLSLDDYLPTYQFSEYHEIEIDRQADVVFTAVKELDLSQSEVVNFLFRLRGLPKDMHNLSAFLDYGFIFLEEYENEEIILGFLIARGGLTKVSAAEFRNLSSKDYIKGTWNFKLSSCGNKTRLSTETRVFCPTRRSRIRFSIYWFFISQFSGLIRMIMLRMIKQHAEALD
jgi:hypothetical protein